MDDICIFVDDAAPDMELEVFRDDVVARPAHQRSVRRVEALIQAEQGAAFRDVQQSRQGIIGARRAQMAVAPRGDGASFSSVEVVDHRIAEIRLQLGDSHDGFRQEVFEIYHRNAINLDDTGDADHRIAGPQAQRPGDFGVGLHLSDRQVRDLRRSPDASRQPRVETFQGIQLCFHLKAPLGDERARAVDPLDVAQGFQVPERAADRRPADPEAGGQLILRRELIARLIDPLHDARNHGGLRSLVEGPTIIADLIILHGTSLCHPGC